MCSGLNSHDFYVIGDGHPPNSRALYALSVPVIKGGARVYPQYKELIDPGTYGVD